MRDDKNSACADASERSTRTAKKIGHHDRFAVPGHERVRKAEQRSRRKGNRHCPEARIGGHILEFGKGTAVQPTLEFNQRLHAVILAPCSRGNRFQRSTRMYWVRSALVKVTMPMVKV